MRQRTMYNASLLLLTMTSGAVDAISFIRLGQVFTAAMTGNTVLFGLALFHVLHSPPLRYLIALAGFVIGAGISSFIFHRNRPITRWVASENISVLIELALLVLAAVLVTSHISQSPSLIVSLLGAAMGVQTVVAKRVGINGVTTTVLTVTIVNLVEAIVLKFLKIGSNSSATLTNLFMWFGSIFLYSVGASICGVIIIHSFTLAMWLPVVIVFVVALTIFLKSNSVSEMNS